MNFPRQRCAIFLGLLLAVCSARSQPADAGPRVIRSFSGQFVVTASPEFSLLLHRPDLAANTNLVRLEPSLLAIAAERFKVSLWHQLGLSADAAPSGKIFLTLRPARSLDDEVLVSSAAFAHAWNYRLELPDVLPCQRYARALASVLAHRTAVVIAHRLSTVQIADRVLVLDGGRIVEDGPPAELIHGDGRYAALHRAWAESLA